MRGVRGHVDDRPTFRAVWVGAKRGLGQVGAESTMRLAPLHLLPTSVLHGSFCLEHAHINTRTLTQIYTLLYLGTKTLRWAFP